MDWRFCSTKHLGRSGRHPAGHCVRVPDIVWGHRIALVEQGERGVLRRDAAGAGVEQQLERQRQCVLVPVA